MKAETYLNAMLKADWRYWHAEPGSIVVGRFARENQP